MTRRQRVRAALLQRIGDSGDMNIRLRGETFRMVLEAVSTRETNFAYECADWSTYRDIDALALETLIRLGDWS